MEDYQRNNNENTPRTTAPYAVASLVLGIASLVCSGLGITLVLGIIGLIFSNKGLAEYNARPERYTGDGMLRAGKVTSILGIVLGSMALVVIVLVLMLSFGAIMAALSL